MLEGLAGDSRVIIYLMTGIGVLGILAKIINQLTLYRLVRAACFPPLSPADNVQAGERGGKHAEEYTPTDKARESQI